MERQHIVFIAVAAAAFAALIGLAYFNPFQQTVDGGEEDDGSDIIRVREGEEARVRYSVKVAQMIHDLPTKNALEVRVSSELVVTNVAGLMGQFTYDNYEITYVEDGQEETVTPEEFRTIEYRYNPDRGNTTKYIYNNVDYNIRSEDSQLMVVVKPLDHVKPGERYTVELILHTGTPVGYSINEKIIEIVP